MTAPHFAALAFGAALAMLVMLLWINREPPWSVLAMDQATWEATVAPEAADRAACYGETLEVSLRTGRVGEDGAPADAVFSVPPMTGVLTSGVPPPGEGELLDGTPCLPEPIRATRVRGGFPPYWSGEPPPDPPVLQGVKLHRYSLDVVDSDRALPNEAMWHGMALDGAHVREDGFRYNRLQNDTPFGGLWLLPDHHPSPIGTPVRMRCGQWSCDVSYRIAPTLQLDYSFLLPRDERNRTPASPEPDWLRIDRTARELVLGWRAGEPTAGSAWTLPRRPERAP